MVNFIPTIASVAVFVSQASDSFQGSISTFWQTLLASSIGGLITGGIAIVGVILTNKSSDKRFIDQQHFETAQRKFERTLDLRRDVYLDASESIAKFSSTIGLLANPENKVDDLGRAFADLNTSTSKLLLICDPKTAESAISLVAVYTKAWMRLVVARTPLINLHAEINIIQGFIQTGHEQVSQILARMRDHNENTDADPAKFALLERSYKTATDLMNGYLRKLEPLQEKYTSEMAAFLAAVVREGESVRELHPTFLQRLRVDLDAQPLHAEFAARAATAQDEITTEIQSGFARVANSSHSKNDE